MPILITGGAGFIGVKLAKILLDRGEEVVIFDIRMDESAMRGEERKPTFVRGDITNWPEVLNVVREYKVETIFHLAAMISAASEANPFASIPINVMGTFYTLEAARLFDVKKVIFTSSMGAYGVSSDTVVTDDTLQRPSIVYGVGKVFGELLGLYYGKKFGLDFRGVRFPQLIGPGVKSVGFAQYNPWLIEAAILGKPFEVWVPEDTVVPLMYVKDGVRSLMMLYDAPKEELITKIYNVGQIVPPPTAKNVVDTVKRYYPNAQIFFKPDPKAVEVLKTIPNRILGTNAEKEWGWKVSYSLEDTVKDFIEEFKNMS
jgi:threonine 3-dehydrogenase